MERLGERVEVLAKGRKKVAGERDSVGELSWRRRRSEKAEVLG